jgi:hypothetical protein
MMDVTLKITRRHLVNDLCRMCQAHRRNDYPDPEHPVKAKKP